MELILEFESGEQMCFYFYDIYVDVIWMDASKMNRVE